MNKKTLLAIALAVLILTAGFLTVILMEKRSSDEPKPALKHTIVSSGYGAEERELFALQLSTTSKAFASQIQKLAVLGTDVKMDGCVPDPAVLHARKGQRVVFRNVSSDPIVISFMGRRLSLKAQGSASTDPLELGDRYLERMTITYSCQIRGYESRAGFVYVTR
jgi:hypothetical protein